MTCAARADWTSPQKIGQTTRMAPALAFGGQLNLVHAGNSNDFLYYSVFDSGSWSNNVRLAGERCKGTGPALVATTESGLVLIYRGESTKGNLWLATGGGNEWSAGGQMTDVNGKPIQGAQGIAATTVPSRGHEPIFVVYRDSGNNVWYTAGQASAQGWSVPVKIAGVQTPTAPALSWACTLHMQIVGMGGKIYDCVQNNDGSWTSTAIKDAEGVAVGSAAGSNLYVVYIGKGGEHLWFTSFQNDWTKPTQIKGQDATYAPALAVDGADRLNMVYVGRGGSELYYSQYSP